MDDELADILDRIDEIEIDLDDRVAKIEAYDRLAATTPHGSQAWADVVTGASEHRLALDDFATAIAQLEEIRATGVVTEPSVEAHLLSAHLQAGHESEVTELDRDLRQRSRETYLGDDYHWVGESYEEAGRLKEALRWYNLANRDVDPDDLDELEPFSLWGRLRVRQLLELPEDAYDVGARLLRERERVRWPE